MTDTLLAVSNLKVSIAGLDAVRGVDFEVDRGARVGIVGESGAGKSITALSIMGLLPEAAEASGHVIFDGEDLLSLSESKLGRIRGNRITMVFQDPMTALNPVVRVGTQVAEMFTLHLESSRQVARKKAVDLLERVGLPDPPAKARSFPHELSGGQRQRVLIAIALACSPELLIADEPTTALDVTVQAEILALLSDLVQEEGTSLLLITHDLPVVASQCDEVIVMYGGLVMERGVSQTLLTRPAHPYTAGLIRSQPNPADADVTIERLPVIPGVVPPLGQFPPGCPFRDRCERADSQCAHMPERDSQRSTFWCWHPVLEVS